MSYLIHIKEMKTGTVRRDGPHEGSWAEDGEFIWTEGNFSCDCNRYLFFEQAAGHEPTDEEDERDGGCGDERYRIRVTDDSGNVLYEEDGF